MKTISRAGTAPLPQANALGVIAAVVDAVAAGLDGTSDIAEAIGMADRQGSYYPNAACTLGYVIPRPGSHPTAWMLTERGLRFVGMSASERAEDMADAIALHLSVQVLREEGAGSLEKFYILEGLSEVTARRRVNTIRSWDEWSRRSHDDSVHSEIGEASEATRARAPQVLAARQAAARAAVVPVPEVCPSCRIQMPASGRCSFC